MEHRYYRRTPGHFYVELWCGDDYLGRCRVRNIAPDGMFIETETAEAELREYELVKVVLPSHVGGNAGCEVTGLVCHASPDGVGILLRTEVLRSVA